MNNRSLFSTFGLLATAAVLIVAVALLSALPSLRVDLTEDRLFSLADGTKRIVSTMEEPLELIFFYSDSATEDAPQIRSYGTRVQELLNEIVIASNGNLRLTVVDPEPFSEEEDLATQYGIQAVPVSQGAQAIYFGLVVVQDVDPSEVPLGVRVSETMPLIRPDLEGFLEYEFMKLITKVSNPDRQVVGLITELEIDGGFNPVVGQATQPWMVMDVMRQLYEVQRVDITSGEIDSEIDVLVIVHPQNLSEQMLYAIDQFVLAGGESIIFLDPNADSLVTRAPQGNLIPAAMSSDLPGLLEAWGIEYESDKVLTDNELALRVSMGQSQRPIPHLGMLGVQRSYLNQEDIVTNGLETINLSSTGTIAKAQGAVTTFDPIIVSSADAMLMDSGLLEDVTDPSVLFDEFTSSEQSYVIAARVSGQVDSAFADGRPAPELSDEADDSEEESSEDDADSEEESTADSTLQDLAPHLERSSGPINLLVFADTDMLSDRMWVQVAQFMGQRIPQPFANNGDLVINALDNLSGGADLAGIRSRGRYSRPFTKVIDLQREADDRLRREEAELLDRLAETEQSLEELNQNQDGQVIGQITPEIQAEVDRFNSELLDTRRRLRDVQYQLTEDIEQLGSRLLALNTVLIPVLLTLLSFGLGFLRTQRRKQSLS
ncbi:MAG: GldG family protein [Pseudohongiellaceae bacterium]